MTKNLKKSAVGGNTTGTDSTNITNQSAAQKEYLKDKIKELNTNVRHITQLGMGWFAFFTTATYVAMSWLVGDSATNEDRTILNCVAVVLSAQNILGIFGICAVYHAANKWHEKVIQIENELNSDLERLNLNLTPIETTFTPVRLYWWIHSSLITVLGGLLVAWAFIVRLPVLLVWVLIGVLIVLLGGWLFITRLGRSYYNSKK